MRGDKYKYVQKWRQVGGEVGRVEVQERGTLLQFAYYIIIIISCHDTACSQVEHYSHSACIIAVVIFVCLDI